MKKIHKKRWLSIRRVYWFFRRKNIKIVLAIQKIVLDYFTKQLGTYNVTNTTTTGMSTLLCHKDVDRFIYSFSSFFYFSGLVMPIYVINDGSLTRHDYQKINKHFSTQIKNEKDSGLELNKIITGYKNIQQFRFDPSAHPLRKKFDAIITCPYKKFIYMDSDILFSKKPVEILKWINRDANINLYSAHVPFPNDMFDLEKEVLINSFRMLVSKELLPNANTSFNSGLLCISNKESINLKKLDKILELFRKISFTHHLLVEELSYAYALASDNLKLLPVNKYVNIWAYEEYQRSVTAKTISIHYTSFTKEEQFPSDALKLAFKHHFFK